MPLALVSHAESFRAALAGFDPAVHTGEACAQVVEALAVAEKACAAARARAALRAAACGAHRARGFGDAADWLARGGGTTAGQARAALATAAAAGEGTPAAAALAAGRLSLTQAQVVCATAAAGAGTEAEWVVRAGQVSLTALRDEARRRREAAADVEARHRRQQEARFVRHWRDELGMVRLEAALPPGLGTGLVNRLEAEAERRRRAGRAAGAVATPRAAWAADALVALLSPAGERAGASADLVVVCDLAAWRRGHTHPGEACQVVGGGPVPVAAARELAADAFVKAVVHDGVQVQAVAHLGRHIPAELRTALELGPPPGFPGAVCAEPGCGRRRGLEWDHVHSVAAGGPTSLANLAPRCGPHHRAKTERDRAAGLLQGPGP